MNIKEPRSQTFRVSGNGNTIALHLLEWGDPDNENTLVCAHGLTRNARDFDFLARVLADHYRVICIDYPGRGRSDWLDNPEEYGVPYYTQISGELTGQLALTGIAWLGTSMGGLIGMSLASTPDTCIDHLILNDVGPFIPLAALQRINSYLRTDRVFESLAHYELYLRFVHATFGDISDDQWAHMVEYGHRIDAAGKLRTHYDPNIVHAFATAEQDIDLWALWDAIDCPTLVIRGEDSDLLLADTAEAMTQRGPKADLYTIPNAGHAPSLMAPQQIELIEDWLVDRSARE